MSNRPPIPAWILPMNLLLSVTVAVLGAWVWLLSSHGLPQAQLDAFQLVYRQISEEYVEEPRPEDLENFMWSAIEGMVKSVDQHSQFVRPSDVDEFEKDTAGTYVGIGIVMEAVDGRLTVQFPFIGGPSEDILQVGDVILAVDGVAITGDTPGERRAAARRLLLGPAGSYVTVTVQRDHDQKFDQTIQRGQVQLPSVKWVRTVDDERGIGYAYVQSFQQNTAAELSRALAQLEQTSPLRALVLDLRFNRGGLLDEAVAMANLFIPHGTIVSLKRREWKSAEEGTEEHLADPELCTHPELPIVILTNSGSASASEVVTGALQDHGRAIVVGGRTYGKGVVQSIYRWRNLDFLLKLTTAHYYTPNGRSITPRRITDDGEAAGGIEPNLITELSLADRRRIYNAIHETHDAPAQFREQVLELARVQGFAPPVAPGPDADPQLQAAVEMLADTLDAPGDGKSEKE